MKYELRMNSTMCIHSQFLLHEIITNKERTKTGGYYSLVSVINEIA